MHALLTCRGRQPGFTLIEMTIVIFIIGMLVAGLIGPVQVQLEARDRHHTKELMDEASEALYGYALTNGRLPCPDQDGDGRSDPTYDPADVATAVCTVGTANGFLPWAELGIEQGDSWGNRFTYRVRQPEFTRPARDMACNGNTANEFDLCATGNIVLNTRGDNPATAGTEGKHLHPAATADNVVAVIVSHGRNGYGATSVNDVVRPTAPASYVDENENADNDETFVTRIYSRATTGCVDPSFEAAPLCEFDDIVVPISRTILNSRMVAAGQLP